MCSTVNGDWGPFVSEGCAHSVPSNPGFFVFFIPHSAPCLTTRVSYLPWIKKKTTTKKQRLLTCNLNVIMCCCWVGWPSPSLLNRQSRIHPVLRSHFSVAPCPRTCWPSTHHTSPTSNSGADYPNSWRPPVSLSWIAVPPASPAAPSWPTTLPAPKTHPWQPPWATFTAAAVPCPHWDCCQSALLPWRSPERVYVPFESACCDATDSVPPKAWSSARTFYKSNLQIICWSLSLLTMGAFPLWAVLSSSSSCSRHSYVCSSSCPATPISNKFL